MQRNVSSTKDIEGVSQGGFVDPDLRNVKWYLLTPPQLVIVPSANQPRFLSGEALAI
jgi:hypothetical protein